MAISKRMVLRSGFGFIIGLLVVSTFLAYRVQESFSERSAEIQRRFVLEQELLTDLRRTLWMASISLRDYIIHPTPDPVQFATSMREMEREAELVVRKLSRSGGAQGPSVDALKQEFVSFWVAVRKASQAEWEPAQRYEFLQSDIVPRRDAAGRLLRDIETANHTSLTNNEAEFRATRTAAARRLLGLLAICLVCGTVVALFAMRHSEHLERQSAEQFSEISEAKLELERLSARLMEVQEEERTRLSRELHDEIVQNLAVLKMEIAHAQAVTAGVAPQVSSSLDQARRLAESTVQSVRNISLLLRPSLLDDLGLGPALQWLTEEFSRRTGITCNLEDNLPEDALNSEAVKTCVYRVTQEALRNCEKHSRATNVDVRLRLDDGWLSVRVEDNGVGFPPAGGRVPSQLGLLGMRERAAALGGRLTAGNRPGGGAEIELMVPVGTSAVPSEMMEARA